ncbi:hypothetical protein [Olsenella phocaeensis]|uniref:hypothetical protein n=1 Tax=Olsenella phocaeensis TaxID=1852385 RepID=UPI003A95B3A5
MDGTTGARPDAINWRVEWTEDAKAWNAKSFEDLGPAREFARGLDSGNEKNPRFALFALRMCLVSTCDFIDPDMPAGAIRTI